MSTFAGWPFYGPGGGFLVTDRLRGTGVQFDITDTDSGSGDFFDTRSGEIWVYTGGHVRRKFRVARLGAPIVVEK